MFWVFCVCEFIGGVTGVAGRLVTLLGCELPPPKKGDRVEVAIGTEPTPGVGAGGGGGVRGRLDGMDNPTFPEVVDPDCVGNAMF